MMYICNKYLNITLKHKIHNKIYADMLIEKYNTQKQWIIMLNTKGKTEKARK